jgi:hypothetical protein
VELSRLLACEAIRVARLSDTSGVVLDEAGLKVFAVNASGMCVLESLQSGVVGRGELVEKLMEAFDVDRATAEADVDLFVQTAVRDLVQRDAR